MNETNMWFFMTSNTAPSDYGAAYGVVYGETREEAEENMKKLVKEEFPDIFSDQKQVDEEYTELIRIQNLSKEYPFGPTEYYEE